MIKKRLIFTLAISSLIFASCSNEENTETTDASKEEAKVLPKVEAISAKVQIFEHFFEVQGNLESEKTAILTPENGGKITSIKVNEGDLVSAGTTIAVFDQSVIASNIKELDKNLELAQYMYEKQQTLYDQGVGTEVQLKQAKTQYEALKQTKASLSTQAGKFVLKAPYKGYIEEIFVVEGEVAGPMSPIVRIVNTDKLKVVADISEVYIKNVNTNTSVDVIFPAIQDTIANIKLSRLGKYINSVNRTINAEIKVPSKPTYIPNLMAVVRVRDYVDTAALTIPNQAILEDNKGNAFVFVIDKNNMAQKITVTIGHSYNGISTIKSGIKENDVVVLKGARKLVSGQEIEIQK